MKPIERDNQTQFSAEEPFFEQPVALPQVEQEVKPVVPFFKRRKTIILIITIATLLALVTLYFVNLIIERNRKLGQAPDVQIAAPTPIPDNSLLLEVGQLRQEWKAADPTQLELQPPAVDLTIRLDQPQR